MTKYFGFEHEVVEDTYFSENPKILGIFEYGASVDYDENHPLCMFMRDDESIYVWGLPYRDMDSLRDALHDEADEIAGQLFKRSIAEDESRVLGISYLFEIEDFDNQDDPASIADQVYDDLLATIENSYVNGDSGFVLAIIDLMNDEAVVSGYHDFSYLSGGYIDEMAADAED